MANPTQGKDLDESDFDPKNLPEEYSQLLSFICRKVSNKAFKNPNNYDANWDGTIFENFVDCMLAIPHVRFKELLESNGINYQRTFKRTHSQGISPKTAKTVFCLSAKAQRIPLKRVLENFVFYCDQEALNLEAFHGHSKIIELILSHTRQQGSLANYQHLMPSKNQPRLRPPQTRDKESINYYGNHKLKVLGRENEQKRLVDFLDCDKPFAWFQIAGVGGQGKSRLAYELTLIAKKEDWSAGFLDKKDAGNFEDQWKQWQPNSPTLIVIDYVIGQVETIKTIIQALALQQNELREPVRLLLIERQRWDRGGLKKHELRYGDKQYKFLPNADDFSEWYLELTDDDVYNKDINECRYETGVEELTKLDHESLVNIVQQVAKLTSDNEVSVTKSYIKEKLEHIDKEGRPLYAYFLGQQLANDLQTNVNTKEELLNEVLKREYRNRWKAVFGKDAPRIGEGVPAMQLSVLSTLAGGIDCQEASKSGFMEKVDHRTFQQALVITDGSRGDDGFAIEQNIPSMQPDILAEWFVISSFQGGLSLREIMNTAWRYSPNRVASFLQRIVQDFPKNLVTKNILEFSPPDSASSQALAKVASTIMIELDIARCPKPDAIMSAIKLAAEANDARAMNILGYSYHVGRGMKADYDAAVSWYKKAAKKGNVSAMKNLASCYLVGQGVDISFSESIRWHKKADEAAKKAATIDYDAFCINTYDSYPEIPARWSLEDADAGNASAMGQLGHLYEIGCGVERNLKEAVSWYKRGAEGGDEYSMRQLGLKYLLGEIVEPNFYEAERLFQKAAEAGDCTATEMLSITHHARELSNTDEGDHPSDTAWANRQIIHLIKSEWDDPPLYRSHWHIPDTEEAISILTRLGRAFRVTGLIPKLSEFTSQRIRTTPLSFYPKHSLVDVQFLNSLAQEVIICSAVVGPRSAALLRFRPDDGLAIIHAINHFLLNLDADHAPGHYLRFLHSYVGFCRSPLHILNDLSEIKVNPDSNAQLPEIVIDSFFPMRHLEGNFMTEGWERFEICILHTDNFYISTLKLHKSGCVEDEETTLVAEALPILQHRYSHSFNYNTCGIFRIPEM